VRILLAAACVLVLLCLGGAWWWISRPEFGDEVRRAGGRYRSEMVDSPTMAFFRFLGGRQPKVYHWIDFEGSDVDDRWLHAHREDVARCTILVLFLRETRVTGQGLSTLHGMRNLTFLDLTGTPLTDADLPTTVQLHIGRTGISGSALAGLSQTPKLVHLSIDSTQATPEGIAGLATCPRLSSLTLIDAEDESVEQVAQLKRVQNLIVAGKEVTAASLPALKRLPGLQSLTIYGSDLSDDDLQDLQQSLPGCRVGTFPLEVLDRARESVWENQ
jgi:hypothetical protein